MNRGDVMYAKVGDRVKSPYGYDLEIIDFESLKKMSTAGVFITGNHIKMLFQYDAKTIEKSILGLIKNN